MKQKQRGVVEVVIIIAITLVLMFAGAAGYFYKQNKTLITDKTMLETSLAQAKKDNDKLVEEAKLQKDIIATNQAAVLARDVEIRDLNAKISALSVKLPPVIPKAKECPASQQHEDNSLKRITSLWEAYCLDNPVEACQPQAPTVPQGESK